MTRPIKHYLATAAITAALLASATGCREDTDPAPTAETSTAQPSPSSTAPSPTPELYRTPDAPTATGTDPAQADSLENMPADADAAQGATDAGMATAEIWVQGTVMDQEQWNTALMDTIQPLSRQAYENRWWGYRVPATQITGEPILSEATMTTAVVTVPTDAGDLVMTVTRTDASSPWLTAGLETP